MSKNSKALYVCCSNRTIRHDGEEYSKGMLIELTDKQAQPLLGVNAIRELDADELEKFQVGGGDTESGGSEVGGDTDEASRKAKIIEAINSLEVGNKEHWTNDGKPDAQVLSKLVGFTVGAALRNSIWAEMQSVEK